jgi:sigma-E factor negative regulatory protein RseB
MSGSGMSGSGVSGSGVSGSSPAGAGKQPTAFRPWPDQLGSAQLASLRASGWPVPGPMPGGLTLFDARQSATAAGRVVDFAYSDGLSVVSLFVQRGRLPAALPGWHQTDVRGNRLYVSNPGEPDLTWSAGGFVYTVVAGAPAPTVAAVVNALPHEAGLGFWGRMKHGLRRLWSWINPFR